jgi:hypothetical protein
LSTVSTGPSILLSNSISLNVFHFSQQILKAFQLLSNFQ